MSLILHQLGTSPDVPRRNCATPYVWRLTTAPHNLAFASICFRLVDEAEAEAATRHAIALGMDDVHSYLLLGRILSKQGRSGEAEAAWRMAVRRNPASPQAQRELAELVWMRTGDLALARAELDAAPQTPEIVAITVRLLQAAGEEDAAYALAAARADRDPTLNILAARAGLRIDPRDADRRLAAAPPGTTPGARAKGEIEVDLALGRIEQAVRRSEALHASCPGDQHATALLAVAWRLAGDPRYNLLYDYDRLVKTYRIDPPEGWSSLDAYLADLGRALDAIHVPINPSSGPIACGMAARPCATWPIIPMRRSALCFTQSIRRSAGTSPPSVSLIGVMKSAAPGRCA